MDDIAVSPGQQQSPPYPGKPSAQVTLVPTPGQSSLSTAEIPSTVPKSTSLQATIITTTSTGDVLSRPLATIVKPIKKPDGVPLFRRDIQYDLLECLFTDPREVFTSSFYPNKASLTFSQLYIEALIQSKNSSKVIQSKFKYDPEVAKNNAFVCVLVNVGKMNTTLTFFPEMRAALRTYHPLPSLQAGKHESNAKHLQDSPRIKSILKGVQDLRQEPLLFDSVISAQQSGHFPTGSPISILFVFANYCTRISEKHFQKPDVFYEIFNGLSYTPQSRANALLWLLYHYLETDGSVEAAQHNPFGRPGDGQFHVPPFVKATEAELAIIDKDTETEIAYAERMSRERQLYLEKVQVENPNFHAKKRASNVAKKEWSDKQGTGPGTDDAVDVGVDPQQQQTHLPELRPAPAAGSIGYLLNEPGKETTGPPASNSGRRHSTRPRKQRVTEGYDELSDAEDRAENEAQENESHDGHHSLHHEDHDLDNSLVTKEMKRRFKKRMQHVRRERKGRSAMQREQENFRIKMYDFPDGLDRLDGFEGAEYANSLLTTLKRAALAQKHMKRRRSSDHGETAVRRSIVGGKHY